MKLSHAILFTIMISSCNSTSKTGNNSAVENSIPVIEETSLIVLGTVQDAGSPQAGCKKDCCKALFTHPDPDRKVVSLGIIDPANKKNYIIEATPDLAYQLKNLKWHSSFSTKETPDGIFLTHAHIGHYSGLCGGVGQGGF